RRCALPTSVGTSWRSVTRRARWWISFCVTRRAASSTRRSATGPRSSVSERELARICPTIAATRVAPWWALSSASRSLAASPAGAPRWARGARALLVASRGYGRGFVAPWRVPAKRRPQPGEPLGLREPLLHLLAARDVAREPQQRRAALPLDGHR